MRVKYRLVDVGRNKRSGMVEAQTGHPEHVEAVVLRKAQEYLRSHDIDLFVQVDDAGDVDHGDIVAGGFHTVGRFERAPATDVQGRIA